MLKHAAYRNLNWPQAGPESGRLVYATIDDCCYFSGTVRPDDTGVSSTVDSAGNIIRAIASREGMALDRLRFFDLQTYRGYDWPPGIFLLNEVVFGVIASGGAPRPVLRLVKPPGDPILRARDGITSGIAVERYAPAECPLEVFILFRYHIGNPTPPPQILSWEQAVKGGYRPTSIYGQHPAYAFSYIHFYRRPDVSLVPVDLIGNLEFIVLSRGNRYSVWQRAVAS
ncbi:MAG: hypothetical protein Q8R13_04015 [bacterium]|nr:hypothetical protein [bacterium]MDZ4296298.1 hypothetical protein [Patescibacteria group bacterium]